MQTSFALTALAIVALFAPHAAASTPEKFAVLAEAPAEAFVTDVVWIKSAAGGAKIYSTAAGDPAVNGLHTYLAIATDGPENSWRVFPIGNFNTWELADETADHVILAITRNTVDQNGDITTIDERLTIPLVGPNATGITVTTAK